MTVTTNYRNDEICLTIRESRLSSSRNKLKCNINLPPPPPVGYGKRIEGEEGFFADVRGDVEDILWICSDIVTPGIGQDSLSSSPASSFFLVRWLIAKVHNGLGI